MKAKTDNQKQIVLLRNKRKLNDKLVDDRVRKWAFNNCFTHLGFVTSDKATCLSCTNVMQVDKSKESVRCSKCKRKLKLVRTKKQKAEELVYVGKLFTVGDFQVLRVFYMKVLFKKGELPNFIMTTVFEDWISPDLKSEFIARVFTVGFYNDGGIWTCGLDLRNGDRRSDIMPYVGNVEFYNKGSIREDIARMGITLESLKNFVGFDLLELIKAGGSASVAETLIKRNCKPFLKEFIVNEDKVKQHWRSIKIALKNDYTPLDVGMWFDYLDNLAFMDKDVLCPKYILPNDLHLEHNRYMLMAIDKEELEGGEVVRDKMAIENKLYVQRIRKFFPLHFQENDISIELLKSVQEVRKEGRVLFHCVHRNGFYKKKSRLLFSAKVNGVNMETIEYDLKTRSILQQRGYDNKDSAYHQQIESLFLNNINKINELNV